MGKNVFKSPFSAERRDICVQADKNLILGHKCGVYEQTLSLADHLSADICPLGQGSDGKAEPGPDFS